MDEDLMNKIMMTACMVLAVIGGLGVVVNMIVLANGFSWGALISVPVLGVTAGAGVYGSIYFGHRTSGFQTVFSNPGEKEVLSWKQRQELRRARGSVVMERALVEVEHERQNITHMQIEASKDPEKPPHETQWSKGQSPPSLPTGYAHPPHHEHYPYTEDHEG